MFTVDIESKFKALESKIKSYFGVTNSKIDAIKIVKSVQRGTISEEFIEGDAAFDNGYQDYIISSVNMQKSFLFISSFEQVFRTVPTSSSSYKSAFMPRVELINDTTIRVYITGFGKTGSSSGKSYGRIRCQWQVIEYN